VFSEKKGELSVSDRRQLYMSFTWWSAYSLCVILITIKENKQTDRVIIYPVGFLNSQVNKIFPDGYAFSLCVVQKP
jgi:predicted glycosyltransferase involved in capsule biosynthesis